jgi:hypothetical protein
MTRSEIISIFQKNVLKNYKSGCECIFVKLDKKMGLKLYSSKKERNHAYNYQRIAAHHELAPPVYNRLSIPGFSVVINEYDYAEIMPLKTGKIHGYVTALASQPKESDSLYPKMDKLSDKLSMIDIHILDLHDENVGFYNRKLVAIDFGPVSVI